MTLKQELKKYTEEELKELKHVTTKLSNKLILNDLKEHKRDTYDEVIENLIKSYIENKKNGVRNK